jgi:hypothetical protein
MQALFTTCEGALYCHRSPRTLEKYRVVGRRPALHHISHRAIRYRQDDLDAWIDGKRRRTTSDPPPPDPPGAELSKRPHGTRSRRAPRDRASSRRPASEARRPRAALPLPGARGRAPLGPLEPGQAHLVRRCAQASGDWRDLAGRLPVDRGRDPFAEVAEVNDCRTPTAACASRSSASGRSASPAACRAPLASGAWGMEPRRRGLPAMPCARAAHAAATPRTLTSRLGRMTEKFLKPAAPAR